MTKVTESGHGKANLKSRMDFSKLMNEQENQIKDNHHINKLLTKSSNDQFDLNSRIEMLEKGLKAPIIKNEDNYQKDKNRLVFLGFLFSGIILSIPMIYK